MEYSIIDGQLVPHVSKIEIPKELVQDDPLRQAMMERTFRLMEAQVPFYPRLAVDIEVSCPQPDRLPDPSESQYQVTACSLCSNDGVKRVLLLRRETLQPESFPNGEVEITFFDTEEELIAEIFRYLLKYPFVITFNGDEFDFRYLYTRAVRLGFERKDIPLEYHLNLMGLKYGIHIDLYRFFLNRGLKSYTFDSKYKDESLDSISEALLGEGKLKHEEPINEMSYQRLSQYGFQDAKLTLNLTTYDGDLVMKVITACSRIALQTFEDVTREGISGFFKNLLAYEHRTHGYIIPRKEDILAVKGVITTHSKIKGKKYEGAKVVKPVPGIHFGVTDLDVGSLYPSIFRNWNIGYETIRCVHEECKVNKIPLTGHWYCGKKASMESVMIGCFKDLRINWYKKKAKSGDSYFKAIAGALKAMMVAAYGVFGSEMFPYYCPSAGESVTAIGRSTIERIIEKAVTI